MSPWRQKFGGLRESVRSWDVGRESQRRGGGDDVEDVWRTSRYAGGCGFVEISTNPGHMERTCVDSWEVSAHQLLVPDARRLPGDRHADAAAEEPEGVRAARRVQLDSAGRAGLWSAQACVCACGARRRHQLYCTASRQ